MKKKTVAGYDLSGLKPGPFAPLAAASRRAAAEGCVLLENRNQTLPLREGDRVSLFGRVQKDYLGSGSGSGGLVVVPYRTNLLDALRAEPALSVNEELAALYAAFNEKTPIDWGHGWATEPWYQVEMELEDAVVAKAAAESDVALVVITRLAGESRDNDPTAYDLTPGERDMLAKVTAHFDRVAVLLNVGNIIDMKWVDEFNVPAVLILWQGGMEGGNAAADVLLGRVNPSGCLPDTIALDLADYPSTEGFGDPSAAIYAEDIYVGYRYFETFAPDRVRYPFGFGRSYTTFATEITSATDVGGQIRLTASVTNTGDRPGRHVVQVYFAAPQGKLGRPTRELAAFGKTRLLAPGETEELALVFDLDRMAGYDDSGVTGHAYAYVLEKGEYTVYAGDNVRDAKAVYTLSLDEEIVVEQHEQVLAPTRPFRRMRPSGTEIAWEDAPMRQYDRTERILSRLPAEIPVTGDRGYRLVDVKEGRCSMEAFIAQLSDDDLLAIARGEGMCSPKVTGSGSAFGGITYELQKFGIPAVSTTDGPSGMRLQRADQHATLLPNGTLLAATFDAALNEEIFTLEGIEMLSYEVDTLLGPGINIHRSPLNGRNFEYFSEDPFLAGTMAAAQCRGLNACGVTGTIKHFCANNQERNRNGCDSVVSERALREIYLRPFEMAVKEGGASAVMTSYNLVNGIHAAANYDLNTVVLRDEWGFDGVVMTDWWAHGNEDFGTERSTKLRSPMVRAQNDVYMVVTNGTAGDNTQDDLASALAEGRLTRAELQRNAANICRYAMSVDAMDRYAKVDYRPRKRKENGRILCEVEGDPVKAASFEVPEDCTCEIELTAIVDAKPLEQVGQGIGICHNGTTRFEMHGTEGKAETFTTEAMFEAGRGYVPIYGNPKVKVIKIVIREI